MYRAFVQHKPLRRTFRLLVFLVLVSLGVVHTVMAVPSYRLQLLLTLGGPVTWPVSINNAEEIVGSAFAANEPYVGFYAAGVNSIAQIGHTTTLPSAINASGVVVGDNADSQGGNVRVFAWHNGSYTDLGPGYAAGINDSGTIVGYNVYGIATIWQGGNIEVLGVPAPGQYSHATGINNAGQVVATITYPDSRRFMALWSNGSWSVTSLQVASAVAINEAGQVVGNTATTTSAPSHAFLWDNGLLRDLGTLLPGGSDPYDVNNLSQVVGLSYPFWFGGEPVAFLWDQGVMYDLNTLLDATGVGWHVATATGINDLGQIVGTAYHPSHGQRGVLLTPTTSPEPTVAFATFTAKLELKLAPRIDDTFDLESRFTLGTGSNGIDPQTEDVTLELKHGTASFTTTIPAGSFTKDKQGYFTVKETVDGVKLDARLTSLGGQQYVFTAEGKHTDLTDIATPVTVTLTIGDDSGSTAVTASLKGQGQRVANGQ